jgi:hypothetical protein
MPVTIHHDHYPSDFFLGYFKEIGVTLADRGIERGYFASFLIGQRRGCGGPSLYDGTQLIAEFLRLAPKRLDFFSACHRRIIAARENSRHRRRPGD